MNFREQVILTIQQLLNLLVIDEDTQTRVGPMSDILFITPNTNYASGVRSLLLEPVEQAQLEVGTRSNCPSIFISFERGFRDEDIDTNLSHIVERLEIRLDIVLDKKIGVEEAGSVRPMTLQISDILTDIQKVLPLDDIQQMVRIDDEIVHDFRLVEWGFDDIFHGSELEVVSVIFQAVIAHNPDNTNQ